VVSKNSGFVSSSRQASQERNRTASFTTNRRVASFRKHTPFARHDNAAATPTASLGVASFYTEGTRTANGEKFNTHELTAAHPTLPFGTKLRVTNVASGRSVTVRINDRGPYVAGRVVDVSYSAADALGRAECLDALRYDGLLRRHELTFGPFYRRVVTTDALEVGASGDGDNR